MMDYNSGTEILSKMFTLIDARFPVSIGDLGMNNQMGNSPDPQITVYASPPPPKKKGTNMFTALRFI